MSALVREMLLKTTISVSMTRRNLQHQATVAQQKIAIAQLHSSVDYWKEQAKKWETQSETWSNHFAQAEKEKVALMSSMQRVNESAVSVGDLDLSEHAYLTTNNGSQADRRSPMMGSGSARSDDRGGPLQQIPFHHRDYQLPLPPGEPAMGDRTQKRVDRSNAPSNALRNRNDKGIPSSTRVTVLVRTSQRS